MKTDVKFLYGYDESENLQYNYNYAISMQWITINFFVIDPALPGPQVYAHHDADISWTRN